jgi:hypothetical protein
MWLYVIGGGSYEVALAALNVVQTILVGWLANRAVRRDRHQNGSSCRRCSEMEMRWKQSLKAHHRYHVDSGL